MHTWTFGERHPKVPGPWSGEPDKAQWIDAVHDLDCLIVRNHMGALCGYVGVPPGHPWHGVHYSDYSPDGPGLVEVHGDLTFSGFCQEGAEDGPGVCHVPEPGRPPNVWWLGFDCSHAFDRIPAREEAEYRTLMAGLSGNHHREDVYRDFEYVQLEVTRLAAQVAASR